MPDDTRRARTRQNRHLYSSDLAALALGVCLTPAVFAVVESVVVRTLLGVVLVTFAPGYAIVAAAFPTRPRKTADVGGLDRIERLVVAVGTSIAVVMIGTLALSPLFPEGLTTIPYVEVLVITTLAVTIVAYLRRRAVAPADRDGVPALRTLFAVARSTNRFEVLLVVSMIAAVGVVGHGVAAPPADAGYTSVSLLTEGDDGDLVAAGYPETVEAGESIPVTLQLENQERTDETYTVVVVLERIRPDSDTVVQRSRLETETIAVDRGETVNAQLEVEPDLLGEHLRVSYYVYRDDPAEIADAESAYRHTYLWVSVEEDDDESVAPSRSAAPASVAAADEHRRA